MRMEGWFVLGTRNGHLRGGRILLCSAFCVTGRRGISPCVVNSETATPLGTGGSNVCDTVG